MTYIKKRLPFMPWIVLTGILLPVCAQAVPVSFQWSDTVTGASLPAGVSAGDPFTFTIVVDNGGSTTVSQTWTGADFVSASIDVNSGAYMGSATTIDVLAGSFQTDAGSNIVAVPTDWEDGVASGTDNLGNMVLSWFIRGSNPIWGSPGFEIGALNVASNNTDPSVWSVASVSSPAIPEPATVVLMGLGLLGLGVAGRRKLGS
jgi:hypothetical protein